MKRSECTTATEPETCMWLVSIWDGFSTRHFYRRGNYPQVSASLQHKPPGYICSVSDPKLLTAMHTLTEQACLILRRRSHNLKRLWFALSLLHGVLPVTGNVRP